MNHHLKDWATSEYKAALYAGVLERPDVCQRCGKTCSPEGHHVDYAKPLKIEWLCVKCHRREHGPDVARGHARRRPRGSRDSKSVMMQSVRITPAMDEKLDELWGELLKLNPDLTRASAIREAIRRGIQ